jgi:hypothetical protein
MTLHVETTDFTALPADIIRAATGEDSGYLLPVRVVQNFDHYRYERCTLCRGLITDHVWFAADISGDTRVLRCSNTETAS